MVRGRPINQNSARQKRLRQRVPGRGRGRPVKQNSARQRSLRQMVPGSKRGRPVDPMSARQQKINKSIQPLQWSDMDTQFEISDSGEVSVIAPVCHITDADDLFKRPASVTGTPPE